MRVNLLLASLAMAFSFPALNRVTFTLRLLKICTHTRCIPYDDQVMACLVEYFRPWKLITFMIGLALLIIGSYYYDAPDWDIPISIIMAILTYLFAPLSIRIIVGRKWHLWPVMLFVTWFSVDGCYAVYWHFKNPAALEMMRDVNFPASLSLYVMCGIIWMYQGSLKQLFSDIQHHY